MKDIRKLLAVLVWTFSHLQNATAQSCHGAFPDCHPSESRYESRQPLAITVLSKAFPGQTVQLKVTGMPEAAFNARLFYGIDTEEYCFSNLNNACLGFRPLGSFPLRGDLLSLPLPNFSEPASIYVQLIFQERIHGDTVTDVSTVERIDLADAHSLLAQPEPFAGELSLLRRLPLDKADLFIPSATEEESVAVHLEARADDGIRLTRHGQPHIRLFNAQGQDIPFAAQALTTDSAGNITSMQVRFSTQLTHATRSIFYEKGSGDAPEPEGNLAQRAGDAWVLDNGLVRVEFGQRGSRSIFERIVSGTQELIAPGQLNSVDIGGLTLPGQSTVLGTQLLHANSQTATHKTRLAMPARDDGPAFVVDAYTKISRGSTAVAITLVFHGSSLDRANSNLEKQVLLDPQDEGPRFFIQLPAEMQNVSNLLATFPNAIHDGEPVSAAEPAGTVHRAQLNQNDSLRQMLSFAEPSNYVSLGYYNGLCRNADARPPADSFLDEHACLHFETEGYGVFKNASNLLPQGSFRSRNEYPALFGGVLLVPSGAGLSFLARQPLRFPGKWEVSRRTHTLVFSGMPKELRAHTRTGIPETKRKVYELVLRAHQGESEGEAMRTLFNLERGLITHQPAAQRNRSRASTKVTDTWMREQFLTALDAAPVVLRPRRERAKHDFTWRFRRDKEERKIPLRNAQIFFGVPTGSHYTNAIEDGHTALEQYVSFVPDGMRNVVYQSSMPETDDIWDPVLRDSHFAAGDPERLVSSFLVEQDAITREYIEILTDDLLTFNTSLDTEHYTRYHQFSNLMVLFGAFEIGSTFDDLPELQTALYSALTHYLLKEYNASECVGWTSSIDASQEEFGLGFYLNGSETSAFDVLAMARLLRAAMKWAIRHEYQDFIPLIQRRALEINIAGNIIAPARNDSARVYDRLPIWQSWACGSVDQPEQLFYYQNQLSDARIASFALSSASFGEGLAGSSISHRDLQRFLMLGEQSKGYQIFHPDAQEAIYFYLLQRGLLP